MKQRMLSLILCLSFLYGNSQVTKIDHHKIKEDLAEIIADLSQNYVFLQEKDIDLTCIREYYEKQIPHLSTEEEVVLFFEYLLDEFYDSHLILTTNRNSSFRLYSPIYATLEDGKSIISNVWQTQIENLDQHLIGAELLKINGIDVDEAIEQFPTHCNDKHAEKTREWIVNKILAGRYNQARVLRLQVANGKTIEYDLDQLELKQTDQLITSRVENGIGIIRIHNSLGNNELVHAFDQTLDDLSNTRGVIIDLRNTVDGGNSYVARGIMGRFILEPKPYQKHWKMEQYGGNPAIERSWLEYVSPRGIPYQKPLVVLVGRWTGSMGEGLAIGFEGMERAEVVGSEMERLAGEMDGFSFINQRFGYRISTAKLFHLNGTARERYIPTNYVKQTTTEKDETLERALELILKAEK